MLCNDLTCLPHENDDFINVHLPLVHFALALANAFLISDAQIRWLCLQVRISV